MATTPIPGLRCVRATRPSELLHDIMRPMVCLVVQGAKHVSMGTRNFAFSAGDSLLITADVPIVSQITRATVAAPYYSLVLELDPAVIAGLAAEMEAVEVVRRGPVQVDPTEHEVTDVALRLMQLLDRPASMPMLQDQLVREMHYWLMAGKHGDAIRGLGFADGPVARIARTVAKLRADYARTVPVEVLAAIAGMSLSTFHQHFKAVTSLSPLQFQKQLRLIEARRLMLFEQRSIGHAAFDVGYESVPQFTREYGRLFGAPPARDMRAARLGLLAA